MHIQMEWNASNIDRFHRNVTGTLCERNLCTNLIEMRANGLFDFKWKITFKLAGFSFVKRLQAFRRPNRPNAIKSKANNVFVFVLYD